MLTDDEDLELGRLFLPVEAAIELGISPSTISTWHARRDRTGLHRAGEDNRGRPLFWEADLLALRNGIKLRDQGGRRLVLSLDDTRLGPPDLTSKDPP